MKSQGKSYVRLNSYAHFLCALLTASLIHDSLFTTTFITVHWLQVNDRHVSGVQAIGTNHNYSSPRAFNVRWSGANVRRHSPRQIATTPIRGYAVRVVLRCTVLLCTALAVLYCTVLHCTVLYCTVLYCTALHCTALHCTARTVLYYTALYCTVLYYTAQYCSVLHRTVLYGTALYCPVLLCCAVLIQLIKR